eukprot:scaffold24640_cov68-Cyclotella_meneghiniana.AAC.6
MKLINILSALTLIVTTATAEWEWAGTFELADASHTWIVQKTDGSYVDPSMKIVFYAVDVPSDIDATIHMYEEEAAALIDSADGSCVEITSGNTIDLATQACYTLVFDQENDDSTFPIDTDGLAGMVVFGQHVPIEFERDMHYLKDSSGDDVEPVLEEGAEGHAHDHGDGHDHGDSGAPDSSGQSCACAAEEYGFSIDCSATAAMLDAMTLLKNGGCADDCSSKACEEAYLLVQSHHDYCPEDKVPEEVEDGFHDYDSTCLPCDIGRAYIDGAPDCPAAKCDDSGNEAYTALLDAGCLSDCSSTECRDNFFILRVEHDLCPHDTLTRAAEEGLHDLEGPCAEQLCNVEGAEKTTPTCESSGAAAGLSAVAFGLFGVALMMA